MFPLSVKPDLLQPCRTVLKSISDLLFPPLCLVCSSPPQPHSSLLFCAECENKVELLKSPLCICCGRMFPKSTGGDHLCGKCLAGKWYFEMARGLVLYEKPISEVIHRFKYQGQTVSLKTFRNIFLEISASEFHNPDLIIPVPLHPKKLRQRGFNQSVILARALFDNKLVDHSILERVRNTAPQTGLNGKERRRNLKNAFQITDKKSVNNKKIVLVDDVFTTGTTVNECARILKRAGAKKVMVLTLARVAE